jgi:hypothetical protein
VPAVASAGTAAATATAADSSAGAGGVSKKHARSEDGRLQSGKSAKLSFGLKAKSSKAVASKRQQSDDLDSGNNSSSDDDTQQYDAKQARAAELELRRPGRHASHVQQQQQQQSVAKVDSGAAHSSNGHTTAAASSVAVPAAAAAVVIEHACLLCQRGFASAEQLAKHEAKSKLHAENLAKLSA